MKTGTFAARASFAQESMWFLEQLEHGSATYNCQLGLRLTGRLDLDVLERALIALTQRHEVLRTTFDTSDGELLQVIHDDLPWEVDLDDLTGVPDPAAALKEASDVELRRQFDLVNGPVGRANLFRLGETDHVLVLTLDHLTCDAWSMRVLHRDFIALYSALCNETELPPEPAIRYADFAQWQRDWLLGGEMDRQLGFWRDTLADRPPLVRLPGHRPATRQAGRLIQPMDAGVLARLTELGQARNTSLFMVLTAAFATQLSHYSGMTDLVLGSLMANRDQVEIEDVVGYFINTVALRLDLSGDPDVPELLDRTRRVVLDAYANQQVPFDRVVEHLAPDRNAGRVPLVNVMIEYSDVAREPVDLGELRIEPLPLASLPVPVDLVLTIRKDGDTEHAIWQFNSEHLAAATIEVMQRHFAALLAQLAAGEPLTAVRPGELVVAQDRPGTPEVAAPVAEFDSEFASEFDTELGAVVTEVWEKVLRQNGIGPSDDFFALGGHSLAGARVMTHLQRRIEVRLPMRLLFDHPVLADFVAEVGLHLTPTEKGSPCTAR
ncbi:condensation domain-containing protein [Labedaea rhizosphaerae]|uniref:Phosphopantetheine binding protein n=1 Tax=Labedaea rhizosphaerae TaxID=598644 RepID=A0A4R6S0E3_LABRH|nr:condensation domain-containing protein [Labedaea rhizosphaerae]TDP92952.1 phosphopantetheine binding protein [Labedaea rhizosphaerae]